MSSRTFIVLKPDALERGLVDQVTQRFLMEGFVIEHLHFRLVDQELIYNHYKEVIEREGPAFKDWLDDEWVGKPAIAMILTYPKSEGIIVARNLLGHRSPSLAEKGTIRGDFGLKLEDPDLPSMNLVHASDSRESFDKELNLWFHPGV